MHCPPLSFFIFRPEGGRVSLEHLILVKLDAMSCQQSEKPRLEILLLVMLLLILMYSLTLGTTDLLTVNPP